MIAKTLFALFVTLAAGCSNLATAGDSVPDDTPLPPDYGSAQQGCIDAWQSYIDEWVANGGRIQDTIPATRQVIADDGDSRLSRLIRSVWSEQPRPSDETTTGLVFAEIASQEVPHDCGSLVWLPPLLVQTPGVFAEGARQSLQEVAPPTATVDSRTFSNWLVDRLLEPIDDGGATERTE